jgi:tol-pal system protein YbgF
MTKKQGACLLMRYKIFFLAATFLLGVSGCASRDDMDNLQQDMEEVKNRMYRMEKDIGSIRVEAKEGTDNTAKGFQTEIESLRKEVADLQAAQDMTRVDLQSLTGKLEDAKQTATKPLEDMNLLKEDTDRRLLALEGKVAGQEKAPAETSAKDETAETMYQGGIDNFKSGNMKQARDVFSKFVGLYPKHELAANAHYWIGETYYNEKNLEQAILEYQEVIKNFPNKDKAPAAMLKQAMAFKGLGDDKSAKYVYKKLIQDYPSSEEAKKAKDKLKVLK